MTKKNKIQKVSESIDLQGMQNFFEEMIQTQHQDSELMVQGISAFITGALELTKMVIDNRVRNSEKLDDQQIYEIYTNSLNHISSAIPE